MSIIKGRRGNSRLLCSTIVRVQANNILTLWFFLKYIWLVEFALSKNGFVEVTFLVFSLSTVYKAGAENNWVGIWP